jgi:hypothetical protein
MKIPSLVYIIVGLAVSLFSRYVSQRTENNGLELFFYVGIGFIIWGTFRLILGFVLSDKSKKPKEKETKKNNYSDDKTVIRCHVCSVKHYSTSNYCHMCGTKLLK